MQLHVFDICSGLKGLSGLVESWRNCVLKDLNSFLSCLSWGRASLSPQLIDVVIQQGDVMQGFSLANLLRLFSSPKQFARETYEPYLGIEELDQMAVVDEQIYPYQRGRVRYRGSYWFAMSEQDICILPETPVLVVGRESLTLVVKTLPTLEKAVVACP